MSDSLENQNELPNGWININLGQIVEFNYGKGLVKANRDGSGIYKVFGSNGVVGLHTNFLVEKPCLIVGRKGAAGEVHISYEPCWPIDTTYFVLPSENLNLRFIYYLVKNLNLSQLDKSTAIPGLNRDDAYKKNIPLPPLPEQHRIVAKLEELFTKLDVSVAELKKAKAQIKRYRQSVLKSAFEGKLTNDYVKEGELPDGWNRKSIKEITSILGDGLHGTPHYSDDGEFYFINGNNLSDGIIEIKANTKRVTKEEFERYKKTLNDRTIFVSINGTLGNTAFYNGEKVILGKSACYFNLIESVDKHFIRYCITTQRFMNYANETATGSTIKNVSLKAMREFEIPLPPTIEEQQAIVSEIERHFSVADATEKIIDQSLMQAERLRQCILKDAFTGKLVPQDPNDPPASELLAKIKVEKERLNDTSKNKRRTSEPAEKLLERIKAERAKVNVGKRKP